MAERNWTYIVAGCLFWGAIRDMLGRLSLDDSSLKWHEGKGWIDRRWDIRGEPRIIRIIENQMRQWNMTDEERALESRRVQALIQAQARATPLDEFGSLAALLVKER